MAIKKYTLVLALLGLLQTAAFAQSDASDAYVFDSSKIGVKNMPQFNEFSKNQYPYPARPRDQWEIGGSVGDGLILGDHPVMAHGYTGGIAGSLSLRKSLTHVFSLRAGYTGSIISIPHFIDDFTHPAQDRKIYRATRNATHMLSMDVIASLNTINHYRGNPKSNIYLLAGWSVASTRVKENFKYNGVQGYHTAYYTPDKTFIFTYGQNKVNGRKAWGVFHAFDYGAGISFKLSDKINLGVEQKFVIPLVGNDKLDGIRVGNSGDSYSFSSIRVNMNLGTGSGKRVAPLWWINPLNYLYNEVNIPKHMKIPPPVLPDGDGDGVTDQFDQEPNTPAGAPVDSHGKAKDTDMDGVPDYKDKEILTPQNCFPVDADGVGHCPEPACCTELRNKIKDLQDDLLKKGHNSCAISSLPSVTFKAGSARLSKDAMSILAGAAEQLKANPTCNVKVVGYISDPTSKRAQQLSWDRVNAVIKYLVEKQGISESRIIFTYGQSGDANTVDLLPTTEMGPNTVDPPHPQYRTTK